MHDVITKTLPHQTPTGLEEIARLSAKWGQDAMNGAAKAVGMAEGELWSWARLKQVDDHLQTLAATKQDSAMLERDEPKAAPAPAGEDPLAAVRDAIDALVEFASEDAVNAGRAIHGGYGCMGPDTVGAQRRYDRVLDEVRKLLLPPPDKAWKTIETTPAPDNGLLTSHNPDRRLL